MPLQPKKVNRDIPLAPTPEPGSFSYSSPFPKDSKPVKKVDTRPEFVKEADSVITDRVTRFEENIDYSKGKNVKALKHIGNVFLQAAGLKK